jgi:hypothetical protein
VVEYGRIIDLTVEIVTRVTLLAASTIDGDPTNRSIVLPSNSSPQLPATIHQPQPAPRSLAIPNAIPNRKFKSKQPPSEHDASASNSSLYPDARNRRS